MEKIEIKKYNQNLGNNKLSYFIIRVDYKLAITYCNLLMKINKLQLKKPLEY